MTWHRSYISDIFEKLTIINVSLHHSKLTLLKSKGIIDSFKKLIMYRYNLARTNLNNFPSLLKYKNDNISYIINPFIIENNELIYYYTDIREELYDIKYNEELQNYEQMIILRFG